MSKLEIEIEGRIGKVYSEDELNNKWCFDLAIQGKKIGDFGFWDTADEAKMHLEFLTEILKLRLTSDLLKLEEAGIKDAEALEKALNIMDNLVENLKTRVMDQMKNIAMSPDNRTVH